MLVLTVVFSSKGIITMDENQAAQPIQHARSPFLITAEAAEFLKLKKRTLDNMRWRGEGPRYRKHGGRICYHIDDLQAWSSASYRR